jgi:hypothetical protein
VGGALAPGKPEQLPPGLELLFDRPSSLPTVPTAQELGTELAALYREVVEKHLGESEVLSYVLAYLACAARIFNHMRKSMALLEARLMKKPDKGVALGEIGRTLLMMTPVEALLLKLEAVPDYILPQLDRLTRAMDVGYFCSLPLLPTPGGPVSVLRVAPTPARYTGPGGGAGLPAGTLQLTAPQAGFLGEFLGPGRLKKL